MLRTYRALGALISYPTKELQEATGEIGSVLAEEGLLTADHRCDIDMMLVEMAGADIYELQERYVLQFDRSRSLSLHLSEHVHGESRDRGQAMADLIELYRVHGFEPTATELPDFLPLFLEFISLLPAKEAQSLLAEPAAILAAMSQRLASRKSSYAPVFAALATLANAPACDAREDSNEDPEDLAALDAAWEEAAVHFGPGEQTDLCGADRLRTRLRAAARDVAIV